MRIAFVCPTVSMGGGTRVIAIYARALADLGHNVCVVSLPKRPVAVLQKLKSWTRGHGWPDDRGQPLSHLDGLGIDHRIIERWRPIADRDIPDGDIVIATWWETAEWVKALSPTKGAKVYFIQHHEIHDFQPKERVRATYRLPFHKIVIAKWLKNLMLEHYGDAIVDVVPNSVDRKQFFAPLRNKQRRPTMGFLYADTPFKCVENILTALRIVQDKFPSLRSLSFGSQKPSRRMALPSNTEFFLLPAQEAIRELYSQCDVWVTASLSEGFNLPALEAMACRTPVVSTRTGWPGEAIKSGWNGVLVEIDDVTALAESIEWVLSQNDENWRVLSSNAYATASTGSWEESAKTFEMALEHARCRMMRGELVLRS